MPAAFANTAFTASRTAGALRKDWLSAVSYTHLDVYKRQDTALARYEQAVLLALEEAENALTSYDRERVRLHHLEVSATSAREAATLARKRYQDGIADFLTVLDAERVALGAQNDIALSRTRVATAWVRIYKAMGGGWNS